MSATTLADEAARGTSPHAESPLPATAGVPSRIPGGRPTAGIPFTRLLGLELRKMLDTRAGRWLLIAIAVVITGALAILLLTDGGQHPFGEYLRATTMPQALILPVVGVLAVTSEWSQRTGLVTFGLEPRRMRVAWAKLLSALLVGVAATALSLALGFMAYQAAVTFRGITPDWTLDGLAVLGASMYVILGIAQGVAFGMLFRNTPAAIVVYYVLPGLWSLLSDMISWLETPAKWLDMNRTMNPLFTGDLTSEQWAQLGTSIGVWIVLPIVAGLLILRRAEVK